MCFRQGLDSDDEYNTGDDCTQWAFHREAGSDLLRDFVHLSNAASIATNFVAPEFGYLSIRLASFKQQLNEHKLHVVGKD